MVRILCELGFEGKVVIYLCHRSHERQFGNGLVGFT